MRKSLYFTMLVISLGLNFLQLFYHSSKEDLFSITKYDTPYIDASKKLLHRDKLNEYDNIMQYSRTAVVQGKTQTCVLFIPISSIVAETNIYCFSRNTGLFSGNL